MATIEHLNGDQRRLLILLLGGRIQPAMMTAFQLKPSAAAFVVSASNAEAAEGAKSVLEARFPGVTILWPPEKVSAYLSDETLAVIDRVVNNHPDYVPAISLTGAPMPMGVGGYEAARRHGCPAYYFDTDDGLILDLHRPEAPTAFQARVSLDDYFLIYDLQPALEGEPPQYRSSPVGRAEAADKLVQAGPIANDLLLALARAGNRPGHKRLTWDLGLQHFALLSDLQALGLLERLRLRAGGPGRNLVEFSVACAGDIAFLQGKWLEEYVARMAEKATQDGEPLFDACCHSLKFRLGNAEREIDFVGIRRGTLLIASCKSGARPWQKEYLDEVEAVGNRLGGNFCTKLFITNQAPPPRVPGGLDPFDQFLAQAWRAGIAVVMGKALSNLAPILCREALDPTYRYRKPPQIGGHFTRGVYGGRADGVS